ncbi:hypothetical protein VULLAG_LOCUS2525 [Vulpes lagopus]
MADGKKQDWETLKRKAVPFDERDTGKQRGDPNCRRTSGFAHSWEAEWRVLAGFAVLALRFRNYKPEMIIRAPTSYFLIQ